MFCPRCRDEYRPGFTECAGCGVPLVERLDEAETLTPPSPSSTPSSRRGSPDPDALRRPLDLTCVFRTGDPGMIALVKSILRSADIPFMTRGEGIQDLAGMGRLAIGYNLAFGPVEFQVPRVDADDAIELLKDLRASE
jgi:hypothetical protein